MNPSLIATAVALRDLKCGSIDTLDDRIVLQKKVYIAQYLGLPLGYGYSWYIHGPYSTDLTTAAYQIIPEGFSSVEGKHLKEQYQSIIDKVNSAEKQSSRVGLDGARWYELLSSIIYCKQRHSDYDDGRLVKKVKSYKPQFEIEQIEKGLQTLRTDLEVG